MRSLAFLLAVMVTCIQGQAQLLPIRTYAYREGLNANSVNTVFRDSRGILWVGTFNGVNWYDGSQFIQPAMTTRSGQIYVNNFIEDSRQSVWITTFYSGLYRWKDGQFTNWLVDTNTLESTANNVFDLVEISPGRYLVATDYNVYDFDGKVFRTLDPGNNRLKGQVNAVAVTPQKDLLIGYGNGVDVYRPTAGGWTYACTILGGKPVSRILAVSNSCWIATEKGLFFYEDAHRIPEQPSPSKSFFEGANARDVFVDSDHAVWVACNGVQKITATGIQSYTTLNGLRSNIVRKVFRDAESITWMATDDGLSRLNEEYYEFYDMDGTDPDIIAINEDRDNQLWLGSYSSLARFHKNSIEAISTIDGRNTGFVSCLLYDSSQQLWAGSDAGILRITGKKIALAYPGIVTTATQGKDQKIWFGDKNGGLICLDHDHFSRITDSTHPIDPIKALYVDTKGLLWVGYGSSGIRVLRIDNQKATLVKEYSTGNGFSNLRVRSICADARDNILVGTRTNGFFVFPPGMVSKESILNVNMQKGISGNWIKSAAMDRRGNIYLATNNGLDILAPNNDYVQPVIRHVPFLNDRVPSELNTVFLQGDTVWLGTAKGVIRFLPEKMIKNNFAPPVYLTRVQVAGHADSPFQWLTTQQGVARLPHTDNSIAFDFAGLSFKEEEAVRYRYRLTGLDKNWQGPTNRRYVNYSNLSPGNYTFSVMAQNRDSLWSAAPASFSFIIATPFWKTWWFESLIGILMLSIAYGVYRYRLRQALQVERLRTRISTDLHDDIGSTLSSISILSDMALHESSPEQSDAMVAEIRDNSLSLMEKMDDIVWSINPKNDSLQDLLLRVKRFAAALFEARDIDYTITIQDDIRTVHLPMEYRQHIYLIMKEAINNLVKYAGATKAGIDVHYTGSFLRVRIQDNGNGFDEREKSSGNGILNMKNRAALMQALLKISSGKTIGTMVELQVKIK